MCPWSRSCSKWRSYQHRCCPSCRTPLRPKLRQRALPLWILIPPFSLLLSIIKKKPLLAGDGVGPLPRLGKKRTHDLVSSLLAAELYLSAGHRVEHVRFCESGKPCFHIEGERLEAISRFCRYGGG